MIKCDNCESPAVYEFSSRGAETAFYCEPCVPWTIADLAAKDNLPKVTQPEVTEIAPAPEAVAKEVAPEAVVEAVAEEVKPSARKKKAADAADTVVSEDATNVENTTNSDEAGASAS